jgi:hypothetical protein
VGYRQISPTFRHVCVASPKNSREKCQKTTKKAGEKAQHFGAFLGPAEAGTTNMLERVIGLASTSRA